MRALSRNELEHVTGGHRVNPDLIPVVPLPPITVTPPPSGGGGGWFPPPPPGGDGGGGGGGGSGSSNSPTFGNLNPPTETAGERASIVEQASDILYDIGIYVPPNTSIVYSDKYEFMNETTKQVRASNSYDKASNESLVYSYATPGEIVITRDAMAPKPNGTGAYTGTFGWEVLEDDQGNVSMNGTHRVVIYDGGDTPLQETVADLAHEIYHEMVYAQTGTYPSCEPDSTGELKAETYGFLAERAFDAAVRNGK